MPDHSYKMEWKDRDNGKCPFYKGKICLMMHVRAYGQSTEWNVVSILKEPAETLEERKKEVESTVDRMFQIVSDTRLVRNPEFAKEKA
jgi:hypothetical protein